MITFDSVNLWQPGSKQKLPILLDCSVHFGPRERIGILAAPGTGKSCLARLLSGIDRPDSGDVFIDGRPSWPIGFAGFLHPELPVGQNITTIAKLCGYPADHALDRVADFIEDRSLLARKTENLSPSERAIVAYALSILTPCDYLICDEVITVGTSKMREKSEAYVEAALRHAGLVLISRSIKQIQQFCERFYVLAGHDLVPCFDLEAGKEALNLAEKTNFKQEPVDA